MGFELKATWEEFRTQLDQAPGLQFSLLGVHVRMCVLGGVCPDLHLSSQVVRERLMEARVVFRVASTPLPGVNSRGIFWRLLQGMGMGFD